MLTLYHDHFAICHTLEVEKIVQMMVFKLPCRICQKFVAVKHKAICCAHFNKLIHIACNNLDKKMHKKIQGLTTNHLPSERIVQSENNAVNNAQYHCH